jgi:hypothetical protein
MDVLLTIDPRPCHCERSEAISGVVLKLIRLRDSANKENPQALIEENGLLYYWGLEWQLSCGMREGQCPSKHEGFMRC